MNLFFKFISFFKIKIIVRFLGWVYDHCLFFNDFFRFINVNFWFYFWIIVLYLSFLPQIVDYSINIKKFIVFFLILVLNFLIKLFLRLVFIGCLFISFLNIITKIFLFKIRLQISILLNFIVFWRWHFVVNTIELVIIIIEKFSCLWVLYLTIILISEMI